MEAKGKATKAVLNHPLRILAMNCQSIKNKEANFIQLFTRQNQTSYFDAVWKDRASDANGGVCTAFKLDLLCTETPELDTNCEIVRCKTNIFGCSSFYRPPDKIDNDYLEEFKSSLSRIMSNRNAHVLVGGDFNCGDIEWSHMQVSQGVQKRQSQ